MTLTRKWLLSLFVVGTVGTAVGIGTFSAFSSQTQNSGNVFAAGTVHLTDNDAGSALYNVSNRKPGDTVVQCINVTYAGSLDADVKLYTTSTIGTVGQYIDLTVEKGTAVGATFPSCGTFSAQGSAIYTGTLSNFASTKNSYANGVSAYPGLTATKWATNDSLVYRFTLQLQDNNSANGAGSGALSSGAHTFTWEARNQ